MKLPDVRGSYRRSGRKLRRARNLYARLISRAVTEDHSLLWVCAERAVQRGLFADGQMMKDIRYRLLRRIFALDDGLVHETLTNHTRTDKITWWNWLMKEGWGTSWHSSTPVNKNIKEVI